MTLYDKEQVDDGYFGLCICITSEATTCRMYIQGHRVHLWYQTYNTYNMIPGETLPK